MTLSNRILAISQRVEIVEAYDERRDALDQRWHEFLGSCGFAAIPIPNCPAIIPNFLNAIQPAGIILSGGNDLAAVGGNAPERDGAETLMTSWGAVHDRPILGVCRGLQLIVQTHGGSLKKVGDHANVRHRVSWQGRDIEVNSFHTWGIEQAPDNFEVLARGQDGNIEAVRHLSRPLTGIMWHPERERRFADHDIELFRSVFGERP